MPQTKIFIFSAFALSSLLATSAYAGDLQKTKTLHDKNCRSCHTSIMSGDPDAIYVRKNRRITNYPALQDQVNRCETNIGIDWPQQKIDDVISYLNQQFYKFKK